jgi:predicted nucleic acid-binding protein
VTYLLDVNALLALVHQEHFFNRRVSQWMKTLDRKKDRLATCSIVELGVVRIFPQLPNVDYSVEEAQDLLARFKASSKFPIMLLADELGVDRLPKWVKNHTQTTDGHLVSLADAHGATLATLDRKIHGAFLVPE